MFSSSPTASFRFCPQCAGTNGAPVSLKHFVCTDCGFTFYTNSAAAVAAFIVDAEGRILWIKRAREPRKGCWNVPGGFVDPEESAETALKREAYEEVGLKIIALRLLASFPNRYRYRSVDYHTIDFFYLCRADGEIMSEESEVAETRWAYPGEMPDSEIAFESTVNAIQILRTAGQSATKFN